MLDFLLSCVVRFIKRMSDFLLNCAVWFMMGVFFAPFLVLGYQIILWLKDGFWTPMPLIKFFVWMDWGIPTKLIFLDVKWKGAHEILWWILDIHIGVLVFLAVVALAILSISLISLYEMTRDDSELPES
jgi:uncharacterized membrane protein